MHRSWEAWWLDQNSAVRTHLVSLKQQDLDTVLQQPTLVPHVFLCRVPAFVFSRRWLLKKTQKQIWVPTCKLAFQVFYPLFISTMFYKRFYWKVIKAIEKTLFYMRTHKNKTKIQKTNNFSETLRNQSRNFWSLKNMFQWFWWASMQNICFTQENQAFQLRINRNKENQCFTSRSLKKP